MLSLLMVWRMTALIVVTSAILAIFDEAYDEHRPIAAILRAGRIRWWFPRSSWQRPAICCTAGSVPALHACSHGT